MRIVFWFAFVAVFYVYVGYPVALSLVSRWRKRPVRKAAWTPTVTIVVAAHNERERIRKRIENCFELDYPRTKLEIIIGLDGPTDGTEAVVREYSADGVLAVHSTSHRGKASILNQAMKVASGDIVVFADARQRFARDAVRALTENFADLQVGAVSGELVLLDETREEATSDMGLYWKYEKCIRSMESEIHSVVGATGAVYAIRRALYRDLPEDTILDDVLTPMRIVMAGRRVVFEPKAKAYDRVACCARAEFGRKVRTLMGNYQLLAGTPELCNPLRNPILLQFLSHKVGRLMAPYLLTTLLVSNVFLHGAVYNAIFVGQCCWYLCALAGHLTMTQNIEAVAAIEDSAGVRERRAA